MLEYFCPYCRHSHGGATHLVSCELRFIQTAPIEGIVELCKQQGMRFDVLDGDHVGLAGELQFDAYVKMLLHYRHDDLQAYFFPDRADLSGKWADLWSQDGPDGMGDFGTQGYADQIESLALMRHDMQRERK